MVNPVEILSTYTLGTPDFGHSDIWHFNLALKFLLSKALKEGYFPLWSKDIGTGFPLLGEGQAGMFNIYNLLAFKFLDPVLAFNLGFTVIILTTALGTYLFCRILKLSKLASVYSAIIFSLSGVFITQAVHYNLIQAASFLPWEFFLTEKFLQTRKKRWLVALALIFSQQIYAGFQQLVLISLVGIGIYLAIKSVTQKKLFLGVPIVIALFFGGILSLPQSLPTLELTQKSVRTIGVSVATLTNFPFTPQNLIGFLNPYFFGDPRVGTYPRFSANWGIFWESTGYIGIIPLILAAITIIKTRKTPTTKLFIAILLVSLVLLLGKSTPLFFVFQIPPLSLFRVPARFLFLFVWALVILAGLGLSRIKNKGLLLIIALISLIDLFKFAFTYHAVINAKNWLEPPETVAVLKKDPDWFRIYTVNPYAQWNTRFLVSDPKDQLFRSGWQDMGRYFDFRHSLDPNQNLYWNIPQTDYYTGIGFRRIELFKYLLSRGIISDPDRQNLTIASGSAKLLAFASVKYLITPYKIADSPGTDTTPPLATIPGNPELYVYRHNHSRPHAYLTRNYDIAKTIADLSQKLLDANNDSVILEKPIAITPTDEPLVPAQVTQNLDTSVTIVATASAQSLLVLTDSYYPGWKAYIDNRETEIYPVNANQRAVVFPPGRHEVRFEYHPLQIF